MSYNIYRCISDITLPVHCVRQSFLKTLLVKKLLSVLSFFKRRMKNDPLSKLVIYIHKVKTLDLIYELKGKILLFHNIIKCLSCSFDLDKNHRENCPSPLSIFMVKNVMV